MGLRTHIMGSVAAWSVSVAVLAMPATALAATPDARPLPAGKADPGRLVLVSLDGFRWDYLDRFEAPQLARVATGGLRAERLLPVFPTLTFPNHYSIATGLTPGRHGIVANRFFDPETGGSFSFRDRDTVEDGRWYGGEPIWVTAERQGMNAAAFFFVGTEADVGGVRPTYWRPFSDAVPGDERVDQVLAWLAETAPDRPRLMTLYFGDVDRAGHDYGALSPEVEAAVRRVDAWIGRLLDGIRSLPDGDGVTVLIVSDHGLADYLPDASRLVVDDHVDLSGARVVGGGPYMWLHHDHESWAVEARDTINSVWTNGRAMLPREAPPEWDLAGHPRFGDLLLLADTGHAVVTRRWRDRPLPPGGHGWAPEDPAMHGILLAAGPGIPAATRVPAVRAVDVYAFMARILDLTPAAGASPGGPALGHLPVARGAGPSGHNSERQAR